MRALLGILVVVLACVASVWGKVATLTPQMGWNSWNKFACNISETLIKETADALVSTGLAALGYNYLNIDDCWHADERDGSGRLQANAIRFPSGMKALGEYIHSRGLKFGIYSSAGFKTCQGFPASLGLEEIDAQTYADWGVDYLKYDNCYQDRGLPQIRYPAMADALEATGRDIFYSLCEWGRENPAVWASDIGAQSWRISMDIRDDWESIKTRAEIGASLWRYAGPNRGWNDPDMLEVGNGGCSLDEYRSHFSLWVMLRAPLIIGNDIRGLDRDSSILSILGNKEVLAIHQDALGRQARITWSDLSSEILPRLATSTPFGHRVLATACAAGRPQAVEDPVSHQLWQWTTEGRLLNPATGNCLHEQETRFSQLAAEFTSHFNLSLDSHAVVATSDCDQATQWTVDTSVGGAIVSQATGLCLEVEKSQVLPIAQGKRIQTSRCQFISPSHDRATPHEHQSWTHPGNQQLRNLYQRQCLTVDRDAYPGVKQEIWTGPLTRDSLAVLLVNKAAVDQVMLLTGERMGWEAAVAASPSDRVYAVRDVWKQQTLASTFQMTSSRLTFLVPPHGSVLLKLTPVD